MIVLSGAATMVVKATGVCRFTLLNNLQDCLQIEQLIGSLPFGDWARDEIYKRTLLNQILWVYKNGSVTSISFVFSKFSSDGTWWRNVVFSGWAHPWSTPRNCLETIMAVFLYIGPRFSIHVPWHEKCTLICIWSFVLGSVFYSVLYW